MKCKINYILNVLATGCLVLLLLSILLFWARAICLVYWEPQGIDTIVGILDIESSPEQEQSELKFGSPGAAGFNMYVLESMQPTIFNLTSHVTALYLEYGWVNNNLLFLHNSFAVRLTGEKDFGPVGGLLVAIIMMLPSIIFAVLLALLVRKNTSLIGLSSRMKFYWTIGTILFGLSAYITYRLTRPGITLVTCENCGKLRRPDMDECHRCGSAWHVPELVPPSWRVIG